jgi:chemotaxis protein MotB
MKSKMLFESGSARLSRDALTVLRNVADILKPLPNQILVEGHTDNVPIRTIAFPSNWELSAARAASVVHLFTRQGVDSSRLAAIGYGEFRPVGDNETEEGRQKNRRVALIMMTELRERTVGDMVGPEGVRP